MCKRVFIRPTRASSDAAVRPLCANRTFPRFKVALLEQDGHDVLYRQKATNVQQKQGGISQPFMH